MLLKIRDFLCLKGMITVSERKKYTNRCRYCNRKVASEGNVCSTCREKLPYVRRLLELANVIKEAAEREREESANGR